jgi:hypothetical protein
VKAPAREPEAVSQSFPETADHGLRPRIEEFQRRGLVAGVLAAAVLLGAWVVRPDDVLPAYLVGFSFWIGIALGSLGLLMLHHLVGGSWGLIVRRPMESAGITVLPLGVLFVPLILDLGRLYPWARPGNVAHEAELGHRGIYLNPTFFLVRAVVYFIVWSALAWILSRLSREQDDRSDLTYSRRMQTISGPGMVVLFLTGSFSAIDWIMSLEPRWVSTVYGAMVITGDALAALAALLVIAAFLARYPPVAEAATPERLNDLGNLMLAFTMMWAYIAFSQFLIIWCGNLPEEIPWYLRRARGPWQWVALALVLFHFFLPFFVLLFRQSKRQIRLIVATATLILVMHWADVVWLIIPAQAEPSRPRIPWPQLPLCLAATLGIGGFWLYFFLGRLKQGPLIPTHDANLLAAAEHAAG